MQRRAFGQTLFCILVVLIGTTVVVGWHLNIELAITLLPGLVPMQYNTALLFILSALALVATTSTGIGARRYLSFLIIAGSLLTGLQYLLEVDFGIDELLHEHTLTTQTSHPGRMAPNTAICFLLIGLALLIRDFPKRIPYALKTGCLAFLATVVLALASMAILGYGLKLESAYSWGGFTSMALHTAIAFFLLAIAVLIAAWKTGLEKRQRRHALPIVSMLFLALTTVALCLYLINQQITERDREIETMANAIADNLSKQINLTVLAIERMAKRWSQNGSTRKDLWQADARAYLDDFAVIDHIGWADQDFNPRLFLGRPNSANIVDIASELKANTTGITQHFDQGHSYALLPKKTQQRLMAICLYAHTPSTNTNSNGVIFSAIDPQKLLSIIRFKNTQRWFSISVDSAEKTATSTGLKRKLDIGSSVFWLSLKTTPAYLANHRTRIPSFVFITGLVISVLSYITIMAWIRSSEREAQAQDLRQELALAMDLAGVGYWRWDFNQDELFFDDKVFELLGFGPDEQAPSLKLFKDRVHPEDLEMVMTTLQERLVSSEVGGSDYRIKLPNGQIRHLSSLGRGYQDERGKPIRAVGVMMDVTDRNVVQETLYELSIRDGLTKLYNRRFFDDALRRSFSSGRRAQAPLSLVLIDIDHFKLINDTLGHQAGDEILAAAASIIASAILRPDDIVARYGGEEFAVLMPLTNQAGAMIVAERIRKAIESKQIKRPFADDKEGPLTVSIGVGTLESFDHYEPENLVKTADNALYEAKNSGRNQVVSLRCRPSDPSAETLA